MRKYLIFLLLLAAQVGVSSFTSADQLEAKPEFTLIYYDGHMHTTYSDGSGSVADIKATALSRGLDLVIVTDHCNSLTKAEWDSLVAETAAASDASFLALPGFEITGSEGFFNRDHINALNAADPFVGDDAAELCPEEVWSSPLNQAGTGPMYPENLAKWSDYIYSQQGIVVHNHPAGTTQSGYGVRHMEIYNQSNVDDAAAYAIALGYPPEAAWFLGLTYNNFALYGERDVNMPVTFPDVPYPIPLRLALWIMTASMPPYVGQWLGSPEAPLNTWDDLLLAYVAGEVDEPVFGLANSDAHNTGDADSSVGVAKNGVYVQGFTAREFFKALKAGRSFATTGPSLYFDVNGEWMGDTAEIDDGLATLHLSANAESPTAVLLRIDIIKNGQVWQTIEPMTPTVETTLTDADVSEDGYYRVEITSFDSASGRPSFAWSNPVFVFTEP